MPVPAYDGARLQRKGLFGVRDPADVEVLVAAELGPLMNEVALPWFEGLKTLDAVASQMGDWLRRFQPAKMTFLWPEVGALWKVPGDDQAADEVWSFASPLDRECARYVTHLKKALDATPAEDSRLGSSTNGREREGAHCGSEH